jgi:hypothetical protein
MIQFIVVRREVCIELDIHEIESEKRFPNNRVDISLYKSIA